MFAIMTSRVAVMGALSLSFAVVGHVLGRDSAEPRVIALAPAEIWQRAEWRIEGIALAKNPFDPDEIRVDATFTAPSGKEMNVPAFWYQEYVRALVDGRQVLTPSGEPHWRLRFTPSETGEYTVRLSVSLNGGPDGATKISRFPVGAAKPSAQTGWVRTASDGRYFESSEGSALRLTGANVCWGGDRGTYDYDDWFPAMRDSGQNFARLWFAPWSMGLEHTPGTLNRYDLAAAWHADYVVQLAEACGLYLVLAMDHHGMFMANDPAWGGTNNFWTRSSPYAVENGGPCATANEFFTLQSARKIYQKRLRYLIARYGYSPHLLSWQFFNEIDNSYVPRSTLVGEDVVAWHREMGRWLRAHDPYAHLISTSLTGASDRPELWELPELDFVVYHSYGEADPALHVASLAGDMQRRYNKPVMIGEIGTSHLNWNIANDPYLRGFRQGLWGGVLGGSVGTSMTWWWEDVHRDRAYPLFTVVRDVMARVGWSGSGPWEPASFAGASPVPEGLGDLRAGGEPFSADLPLNQLRLNPVPGSAAIADPLTASRAAERLSAYLHGSRNPRLQQHARVTAWFADRARLVFRVNSVAADADLVVRIDGTEKLREALVNKDGLATLSDEIDEEFAVEIPAGRRVVEIGHTGSDWVNLRAVRFERMLPAEFAGGWQFPVEAIGLRRGDAAAVVYVRSPYVAWPAGARHYNPPIIRDGRVLLQGWRATATVTWIDPVTGREVATGEVPPIGPDLVLSVPDFTDDLVAIVTNQPGGPRHRVLFSEAR